MITLNEIEETFPFPIKVEISCEPYIFQNVVQNSFEMILTAHNKKYDTKIESIERRLIEWEPGLSENNQCRIFIGKDVVYSMKSPDLSDEISPIIIKYYKSAVKVTSDLLSIWHDRIIEIQNENTLKLEQFKADGYDEMIYGYYCYRHDRRTFKYLKRLATRYPNSGYMKRLRYLYKSGANGWHRRNLRLSKKMFNDEHGEDF